MKIAFLAPHLKVSGGMRIVLMYASLLAKRGHDVVVYVRSSNRIRRTIANYLRLGYPRWIDDFSATIMRVPSFAPEYIRDADATVACPCQAAVLLDAFPSSKGRRYYLVQHDEGLYHERREIADQALRSSLKKIVVSTWLQDVVRERAGQESELLLNPIDTAQFHQLSRTAPTDTIRVLLLHHTYDWKGTAEGSGVIMRVQKRYPQVRLILFGARVKEGITTPYDEYHYNVPQEKLAELYSNADIYLCPSWDEGFGLPSVEAMMCGSALVTYDNGGSRDYAFHEKTALVARRRDSADLERQLERMVREPETRARLAKAGQKFVMQMPGWDEQVSRMEGILSR